ncbi:MAG TPA: hemolysin family protein [Pirellulales bacterium]|jgi:putative hemolysin|nr:hemolysin family protein [Pirellulales bacterium]
MPAYVGEILIILVLILANGFFSAAEMAIVAARRGRLQQRAEEGDKRAATALELIRDPSRFLATGQIGVTLIGTFTAEFGGANLVGELAQWLATLPVPLVALHAHIAALVVVGLAITVATLILGELVPKRLALHRAEQFARFVAPWMERLSRLAGPAVWLMSSATNALLTLVNSETRQGPTVSVDDIEHMIDTGKAEGVVESVEMKVAVEALRLGDRSVREIMRPRIDLDALDADTPVSEVNGAMAMAGFSRLPVYERDLDHIIGFVHIKDLFLQQYLGRPIQLRKLLHPALFVPESLPLDRLLELFQEQHNQLAIVLDEFGGTEGMVTLEDVLEELVGEIRDEHRREKVDLFVQRDENSWLVDGMLSVADLIERLDIRDVDGQEPRGFSTVSGLVLDGLGRIPVVGDATEWAGLRLEVLAMQGQRIDRILVTRLPAGHAAENGTRT